MSDFLESQLVQHLFRTGSYTKPTALALALCSAAVADSHTGATIPEIGNAGSYARQSLNPLDANWNNVTSGNGTTANTGAVTWTAASADWGTVSYVAITDNPTYASGNLLFWGSLTGTKVVNSGDTFQFAASQISVRIDD